MSVTLILFMIKCIVTILTNNEKVKTNSNYLGLFREVLF